LCSANAFSRLADLLTFTTVAPSGRSFQAINAEFSRGKT
jgi:hypothetical protein